MKVIVNQLGYRPGHNRKHVLIADVPGVRGLFNAPLYTVFEQNEFSKYPLNDVRVVPHVHRATLTRVQTDFGRWWIGDFSHIRTPGIYQATCGNHLSPSFAIRDDLWCRILPECLRYFQIQSCGRKVPGWHDACHLDDGYIPELDRYVNAVGGWHDAGDFRKWATSTMVNALALLITHRIWSGRESELGVADGVFLQEALQGVHYFLGVQDPETGGLYHNVGGGREVPHDNLDCRYTDNIRASGDERRIWPGWARPAGKFTTLFAMYASALMESDPDLSARCALAARESLRFDLNEGKDDAEELQWRAWGYLELWRLSAEASDKSAAVATMAQLLDLQVLDFIGGQKQVRGFFRKTPDADDFHRRHIGASYPIWILAEFLDTWPDHPDAGRWRDAIAVWVEDYALFFARRNPFGLLPYAVYPTPPEDHPDLHYRPLGDRLCFRYFMAEFGTNARCSLDAAAMAAAGRILGRPELFSYAYSLLEWTLGNNPFQLSTMNGVGVTQPCTLSFQMGNIPGGVTMGIVGDANDQPLYYDRMACTDEYYGFQTSQFLWAMMALHACDLQQDE